MPSNETIMWLPLIAFNNDSCVMGLTMKGVWVVETKQALVQLDEPLSFVRTLPLLEKPIEVVKQQIRQRLNSEELSIMVELMFPVIDVVRMGFETGSEYWTSLAFTWFDELSVTQKQQLIESLAVVSKARWASQKLRQKAVREIRKLET
jgi:hypothetical protein